MPFGEGFLPTLTLNHSLRRLVIGFRKDKGGEKLAESEEDLLEHRTDGTDAFDTLYIGCETVCANEGRAELVPAMPSAAKLGALVHKFPFHDSFSLSVSGVS